MEPIFTYYPGPFLPKPTKSPVFKQIRKEKNK